MRMFGKDLDLVSHRSFLSAVQCNINRALYRLAFLLFRGGGRGGFDCRLSASANSMPNLFI